MTTYMYVDLIMKENEVTLEKSGWSLSMYVRAYVTKWLYSKISRKRSSAIGIDFSKFLKVDYKKIY